MKAADNGHLDVVKYIFTECGNVIDINAQDRVSVFMYYIFYFVIKIGTPASYFDVEYDSVCDCEFCVVFEIVFVLL